MPFGLLQKNNLFVFLSLVFFAFFLLCVVSPFTLVNGDEGVYVLYAKLFERGQVPIADYDARTPILLLLINASSALFGTSLFAFRLPVVIATALAAGFLFLIGERLFSRRIGIFAGALYALNPYTLWNNSVLKSEMLAILFTVIAAYFIVRAVQENRPLFYLASGFNMGLLFLERHSAAAFILTAISWLIVDAYTNHSRGVLVSYTRVAYRAGLLFLGFLAGFLPAFLWIFFHNPSHALRFWFGIGLEIVQFSAERSTASTYGIFSYPVLREWGLTLVEDIAPEAWIIYPLFVLFLILSSRTLLIQKFTRIHRVVSGGILLVFGGAFIQHSLGIFLTHPNFRPFVFLWSLIGSLPFFLTFFLHSRDAALPRKKGVAFIILWLFGLVLLYSFFNPTYSRELMVPMTLGSAVVVGSCRWEFWRKSSKTISVLAALGLYATSLSWFMNPLTGGWWWTQETMNQTASYLKDRTEVNEEVFTANPLPVFIAERQVFLDISSFSVIHAPRFGERWGLYPSPEELLSTLEQRPPRYTIVDGRMKLHIFSTFPVFEKFVREHYTLVTFFGEGKDRTEVWERVF